MFLRRHATAGRKGGYAVPSYVSQACDRIAERFVLGVSGDRPGKGSVSSGENSHWGRTAGNARQDVLNAVAINVAGERRHAAKGFSRYPADVQEDAFVGSLGAVAGQDGAIAGGLARDDNQVSRLNIQPFPAMHFHPLAAKEEVRNTVM